MKKEKRREKLKKVNLFEDVYVLYTNIHKHTRRNFRTIEKVYH